MRRATPRVLLVAALLAFSGPALAAQRPHEDFERASDDYAVLRILAGTTLARATDGLNASLAREEGRAVAAADEASALARGMEDVVALDAPSATSRALLAPFARASANLTGNTTSLAKDWLRLTELNDTGLLSPGALAEAWVLAAVVREDATEGLANADEHAALAYETRWLRAALEAMLARLDALEIELEKIVPPDAPPYLYLQAFPREVALLEPLTLRGVLSAPGAEGTLVRLAVDGEPWGAVEAGRRGFFTVTREVPLGTAVGEHVATAAARNLTSNDAPFTVVRVETDLSLALPASSFPVNATLNFTARLVDAQGSGVPAWIRIAVDGRDVATLSTDAAGRGEAAWTALALAPGSHVARATFAGTDVHAPSEAEVAFEIVVPSEVAPARSLALASALPWLVLAVFLLLQVAALEASGRRARRLLLPVAVAAPPAAAALAWGLGGSVLVAAGLSIVASVAMALRHRARPQPLAGEALAPLPPEAAAVVEARVATVAAAATGPLAGLVALYREVLERLAREGVDVRALTHREIARAMRERGYADEPVSALTRVVELALYAGAAPDVDAARAAARSLGVVA